MFVKISNPIHQLASSVCAHGYTVANVPHRPYTDPLETFLRKHYHVPEDRPLLPVQHLVYDLVRLNLKVKKIEETVRAQTMELVKPVLDEINATWAKYEGISLDSVPAAKDAVGIYQNYLDRLGHTTFTERGEPSRLGVNVSNGFAYLDQRFIDADGKRQRESTGPLRSFQTRIAPPGHVEYWLLQEQDNSRDEDVGKSINELAGDTVPCTKDSDREEGIDCFDDERDALRKAS